MAQQQGSFGEVRRRWKEIVSVAGKLWPDFGDGRIDDREMFVHS